MHRRMPSLSYVRAHLPIRYQPVPDASEKGIDIGNLPGAVNAA
jgi:hypothetical protein